MRKLPLCTEVGIPEVCTMDLYADAIEVYSQPGLGSYGRAIRLECEGRVVSITLPGLLASDALPPEEQRISQPKDVTFGYILQPPSCPSYCSGS